MGKRTFKNAQVVDKLKAERERRITIDFIKVGGSGHQSRRLERECHENDQLDDCVIVSLSLIDLCYSSQLNENVLLQPVSQRKCGVIVKLNLLVDFEIKPFPDSLLVQALLVFYNLRSRVSTSYRLPCRKVSKKVVKVVPLIYYTLLYHRSFFLLFPPAADCHVLNLTN